MPGYRSAAAGSPGGTGRARSSGVRRVRIRQGSARVPGGVATASGGGGEVGRRPRRPSSALPDPGGPDDGHRRGVGPRLVDHVSASPGWYPSAPGTTRGQRSASAPRTPGAGALHYHHRHRTPGEHRGHGPGRSPRSRRQIRRPQPPAGGSSGSPFVVAGAGPAGHRAGRRLDLPLGGRGRLHQLPDHPQPAGRPRARLQRGRAGRGRLRSAVDVHPGRCCTTSSRGRRSSGPRSCSAWCARPAGSSPAAWPWPRLGGRHDEGTVLPARTADGLGGRRGVGVRHLGPRDVDGLPVARVLVPPAGPGARRGGPGAVPAAVVAWGSAPLDPTRAGPGVRGLRGRPGRRRGLARGGDGPRSAAAVRGAGGRRGWPSRWPTSCSAWPTTPSWSRRRPWPRRPASSWWSQGATYLWNFVAPYTLWLPLRPGRRRGRGRGWRGGGGRATGSGVLVLVHAAGRRAWSTWSTWSRSGATTCTPACCCPAFFALCLPVYVGVRSLRGRAGGARRRHRRVVGGLPRLAAVRPTDRPPTSTPRPSSSPTSATAGSPPPASAHPVTAGRLRPGAVGQGRGGAGPDGPSGAARAPATAGDHQPVRPHRPGGGPCRPGRPCRSPWPSTSRPSASSATWPDPTSTCSTPSRWPTRRQPHHGHPPRPARPREADRPVVDARPASACPGRRRCPVARRRRPWPPPARPWAVTRWPPTCTPITAPLTVSRAVANIGDSLGVHHHVVQRRPGRGRRASSAAAAARR